MGLKIEVKIVAFLLATQFCCLKGTLYKVLFTLHWLLFILVVVDFTLINVNAVYLCVCVCVCARVCLFVVVQISLEQKHFGVWKLWSLFDFVIVCPCFNVGAVCRCGHKKTKMTILSIYSSL